MKKLLLAATAIFAVALSGHASAETVLYPVPTGTESPHFYKGTPTLTMATASGSVEITALPFDHGHLVFGVAVYNKGNASANFGIENVSASIDDASIPVLSEKTLEKRAKSRAMWSQIGVAMLSAGAAAAVANAHTTNHYYGHVQTPHGTYAWSSTYRDNSLGVLGATAAVAGGTAAIIGIQNRLDYTLANLTNDTVQTTTVEASESYGGKIVLEKPKAGAKQPYDVKLSINWNGQDYPFVYRVTEEGKNVPPAYPAAALSPATTDPQPVEVPLTAPPA
jgi:hypothetical protein